MSEQAASETEAGSPDWKRDWLDALHELDDEFPAALVMPVSYEIRHRDGSRQGGERGK